MDLPKNISEIAFLPMGMPALRPLASDLPLKEPVPNTPTPTRSSPRPQGANPGTVKGRSYPFPQNASVFQGFGKSVGVGTGYTGVNVLLAPDFPGYKVLPVIELQALHFNDGTYGAGLGVGGRYLFPSFPGFWGLNAFGSFRQSNRGNFFQFGPGLEIGGNRWLVSGNGYIPLGAKQRTLKCVFNDYVGDFKAVNRQSASMDYGANIQASWEAVRAGNFSLYTFGGPYFFLGSPTVRGGQLGIQPQYGDFLSVWFGVSYDNVNKTLYQGGVALSIPIYKFSSVDKQKTSGGLSARQVYQPTDRLPGGIPLQNRCCWKSNF